MQKIDRIYYETDDNKIDIPEIMGQNQLIQYSDSRYAELLLDAVNSAFLNKIPNNPYLKNAEVTTVNGEKFVWPGSKKNDQRLDNNDVAIMVGKNPFSVIRNLCKDVLFKMEFNRSLIELTQGRIINVQFQPEGGLIYECSNKKLIKPSSFFADETERVRLGILMAAIRRKMSPIFFVRSELLETDLMKRFFSSIIQSEGTQLIILCQLARILMSFPLDRIEKSDNWRYIVLE